MKNRYHLKKDGLLQAAIELKRQTMATVYEVDRFASEVHGTAQLPFLNELASGLEIIEAQLDYHFPDDTNRVDLDEWAHILSALNSAADWIDEQVMEFELRFDAESFTARLRNLSDLFSALIPELISARFEQNERFVHEPDRLRQTPALARRAPDAGAGSGAMVLSNTY